MAMKRAQSAKAPDEYRAVPFDPEKQTAKKTQSFGLKVTPAQAQAAMLVLEQYIAERAELAKDKVRIGNTVNSIKLMDTFKRFTDEIGKRVKSPAEAAYDSIRFTIVPSFMEDEDITSIKVEDVGRVNVMDDVQVKVEDKDKLFEWLKANELEDMITEGVHAQTLAAFVRKRLKDPIDEEEGENLPGAEIITVTPVTRAQITRS